MEIAGFLHIWPKIKFRENKGFVCMHNKKLNDSTLNETTSPLHIILHIIHLSKGGPDATLDFVKLRGLILVFFSTP